ncbi:organomercurial lyase [Streptomyces sp.]|uniref:organomercurial lyase n=1 Tax=Streptomyces sp. TaxID=1931 RepID=UPI0039C8FD7C
MTFRARREGWMAHWEGRGARSRPAVVAIRRRCWDGAARSCTGSAADSACGALNFFTSRATARKWPAQHCEFTGNAVDQTRAEALGGGCLRPTADRMEPRLTKGGRRWWRSTRTIRSPSP